MTSSQTTTQTTQAEFVHRSAWKAGVLGALNALCLLIAVRMILLVGVSGAIVLAYLALLNPDPYRLGVLAIYACVVVVPLVVLAFRR